MGSNTALKNQKYLVRTGWESLTPLTLSSIMGCSLPIRSRRSAHRRSARAVSPLGEGEGCCQPTDPLVTLGTLRDVKAQPPHPTPRCFFYVSRVQPTPKWVQTAAPRPQRMRKQQPRGVPTRGEAHAGPAERSQYRRGAGPTPCARCRPQPPLRGGLSCVGVKLPWAQPSLPATARRGGGGGGVVPATGGDSPSSAEQRLPPVPRRHRTMLPRTERGSPDTERDAATPAPSGGTARARRSPHTHTRRPPPRPAAAHLGAGARRIPLPPPPLTGGSRGRR